MREKFEIPFQQQSLKSRKLCVWLWILKAHDKKLSGFTAFVLGSGVLRLVVVFISMLVHRCVKRLKKNNPITVNNKLELEQTIVSP